MINLTERTRAGYVFRACLIMFGDILSVAVSFMFGLWIRYDFMADKIPHGYLEAVTYFIIYACIIVVLVYRAFRLYQSIWRYASVTEAYRIVLAYMVLALLFLLGNKVEQLRIPRSSLFVAYILCGIFCVMIRFGYRFMRYVLRSEAHEAPYQTMIIGGGQAAREIIKDILLARRAEYKLKVIIDDNPYKIGRYLEGIKIAGSRRDIPRLVKAYHINTIIYAISDATPQDKSEILNICKETGCKIQVVPSLFRLYTGELSVTKLREVRIEDLLGRDEIQVDNEEILQEFSGKTVLVTGGGGSIGSELCRQIAKTNPKLLIIFDIYENGAYDVQQELKIANPGLNVKVLIGSVRDEKRINTVMQQYRPDVVFHAAAHKHVPLMEDSPCEAVKNNVLGTYKTAKAAINAGVKRFLLISTDKAVNPTNVMGASKRLCEMIIQSFAKKNLADSRQQTADSAGEASNTADSVQPAAYSDSTAAGGTVFSAVRFGNVLGSNGSVIPLFKRQIAEGGPVTVTDKNIIRYFMTIPEAVSLILQASHYAEGGEIFVLDMGKPVRIDDMARDLIKLSGYTPDKDIKIVYTGLRPGEKLFEELLMSEEGMRKTRNNLIYVGKPIQFDEAKLEAQIAELDAASANESERIKQAVAEVVDTYKISNKQ
ncbi:MAG: polysaccharide biosynthesis protein [Synergistaceae bacterium]|nr:polysaccharide biosynthesis protein [Candidatus Equadaptatus faecalis]